MLVLRADASIEIGSGHIMRCLALAEALVAMGEQCQFICRELPGHLIETIESRGIVVNRLPSPSPKADKGAKSQKYESWLGVPWQQDVQECKTLLQKLQPDRVIIDHYALDKKWQQAVLPAHTKLMVIDDLADRSHHCDILLDQNLGRKIQDYGQLVPSDCTMLIGPEFALLRPEFSEQRSCSLSRRMHGKMQNILISMGGVDKDNATGKILNVLAQPGLASHINITIILGAKAPWINEVTNLVNQIPGQIELLTDVTNMAEQMAKADLAIGAAGGTSWERCCLGLPTLLLVIAENQIESTKALVNQNAAVFLGTLSKDDWSTELISALTLMQNPNQLSKFSQAAAIVCDGMGCKKVAEKIVASQLSLRKATMEDSRSVWNWRYADGAERFYQTSTKPAYDDHKKWFEVALSDGSRMMLIICKNSEAFAHIRFDILPETLATASVAICLSAHYKGRNLAYSSLQIAINHARDMGIQKFEAVIHHENFASVKLFTRIGFMLHSEVGKLGTYILAS